MFFIHLELNVDWECVLFLWIYPPSKKGYLFCDGLDGWDMVGFGGRVWREELCIYIYLICFFVQQKLTQHHIVIICQFLKKKGYHWYFMNLLNNGMCVCVCVCVCVCSCITREREHCPRYKVCGQAASLQRGTTHLVIYVCCVLWKYAADNLWVHVCSPGGELDPHV